MSVDDLFFLSYAWGDEENESYISGKFFDDLRMKVRLQRGNIPDDPVGFLDKDQKPGTEWPENVGKALQRCKTIVCLYSPTYFNRPVCGQEVQVFLDRRTAHGGQPPVVLPIIWRSPRPGQIPTSMSDILYYNRDFSQAYIQQGLRNLIKLSQYRDDYDVFVEKIATWVLEAAECNLQAAAAVPELAKTANAFDPHRGGPTQGPSAVRFVYVAGIQQDFQNAGSKRTVASYGTRTGSEWKPFASASATRVSRIAEEDAAQRGFFPGTLDLTPDLIGDLHQQKIGNTPVVVFVDPWTLEVAFHSGLMKELDESAKDLSHCATLVLWDSGDGETKGARARLQKLVDQTFPSHREIKFPLFYRPSVETRDELKGHLSGEPKGNPDAQGVLALLRLGIINTGRPAHDLPGAKTPIPGF